VNFTVKRGDVIFRGPNDGRITATGESEVRLVRIEFRGAESKVIWGRTGLAPNYELLIENGYVRVYNIRVAAGTSEPMHTHHDRVVVCLSGAQLRHVLPDGHTEDSSLKTGDCLWRLGQTHVGKNIGKTDLWVIAVEPK
jgi:quercetin dioxygenase-like cupin family protein